MLLQKSLVQLLIIFLPTFATWDCYNKRCTGTGSFASAYINCDNRYNFCAIDWQGQAMCVQDSNQHYGNGVNCSSGESGCKWDDKTGVASCITSIWDCYDMRCKGEGSYSSQYIYCDNAKNYCSIDSYGYPKCVKTGFPSSGTGVNCTSGASDCNWAYETGAAYCMKFWDCYDMKCKGQDYYSSTYINCDNRYSYCSTDIYGHPKCEANNGYPGRGTGVNCNDQWKQHCDSNDRTGVAYCEENSTISSRFIIAVVLLSAIVCLVIVCCCCVYQQAKRRRDQECLEENVTPVVLGNITAIASLQPTVTQNMQLTTVPPPDYQTQQYTQQQIYQQNQELQGYPDEAPPSYEQCVLNLDKF